MSQVVVGGTFNVFHKGHAALLDSAILIASFKECALVIGITTDDFARSTRKVPVRPYKERLRDVEEYVESSDLRRYFGPVGYLLIKSADSMPEMGKDDVLVVSEETAMNAYLVLDSKGYDCEVHVVDMVKDKDGEEIHSTRILEGYDGKIHGRDDEERSG